MDGATEHARGPLARARALADELDAAADEIERSQSFPEPLLSKLHESRLLRLLLPRSVGGEEAPPTDFLLALEEVSRHEGSVGWNMFVANAAALIAPFIPAEAAQEIFSDPRAVVAWGPPNRIKARAVDGGYRVGGRWDFASGCRQATWMGVHCRIEEPDGSLRQDRYGRAMIRTLLFPASEATLLGNWNPIGLKGTASESYTVEDIFVPEGFTGLREEPDTRRDPGPLFAFTMYGLYATGVAGTALGLAGAMLDAFIELAGKKTPRGLSRLADTPAIQSGTARAQVKLNAARALLLDTLREIYDRAPEHDPIALEDRARVRLAATHAIHTSIETADWVYKQAGVSAIFPGTPFERRFRDMHTLSQQVQARDVHYENVGRILFGERPEPFL
jgi:alkylation response protein AidB-like acyl-CoA dehydrogenase